MPIPTSPSFLTNVIGYAADVNTIPDTTTSGSGQLSYQSAFPAITATPLTAGGVAPAREDFNAVIKMLSAHVFFQQSGSLYTWNSALDYLAGAHILGSDGNEYVALQSSGPDTEAGVQNPVSDTEQTYWRNASSTSGGSGGVLPGTIVAFSGTFGGDGNRFPIPLGESTPDTNWCICDGTTTNGLPVPDLRGRFIMGASDTYTAGSTGGSSTHTHTMSGSVGSTTLTTSQMPSHTHSITTYSTLRDCGYASGTPMFWQFTSSTTTGSSGSSSSHTHSLSSVSSTSASSLPLYYALSYIMRCA